MLLQCKLETMTGNTNRKDVADISGNRDHVFGTVEPAFDEHALTDAELDVAVDAIEPILIVAVSEEEEQPLDRHVVAIGEPCTRAGLNVVRPSMILST